MKKFVDFVKFSKFKNCKIVKIEEDRKKRLLDR